MKKATFLFIVISLTLSACVMDGWNNGISGNGNVVDETRDITGFSGVHVSSGIDVYLSEGEEFEVRVEADENLMDVILTELNGNILVVKTERYGIRHAKSKKVHVTLPELEVLKIFHWKWKPTGFTWRLVPAVMQRSREKQIHWMYP